jgi:hypothetical protein
MSLSDLAALGSFISGFAVLVSLVFLYFQLRQVNQQVRQTEKNQQAAIRQERTRRSVEIQLSGIEPSLSEVWHKARLGSEDLSVAGFAQFGFYWRASFLGWEDTFYQHLDGFITDAAFSSFNAFVRIGMRNLGVRAQWRISRNIYGAEFGTWIDKLVAESPILESDPMKNWRDALAAERAGAPY